MPQVGDRVRMKAIPLDIRYIPEETRGVFRHCLGKIFTMREIDEHGHRELWAKDGRDRKRIFGADFSWIEPEYVAITVRLVQG